MMKMSPWKTGWLVLAWMLVGTAGCAEEVQPSTACDANETVTCVCTNGLSGTQTCSADGNRYEACLCESGEDTIASDSGAADATVEDAQPTDVSPVDAVEDATPDTGPFEDVDEDVSDVFADAIIDAVADTVAEDTATEDLAQPEDAGPPACDPPLALQPEKLWANTYSLVTVLASGGSGAYTFVSIDNQSDGTLNPLTGSYLTGGVVGVVDTIGVIDAECAGEAQAIVEVVEKMSVAPLDVTIAPGEGFTFDAQYGSGKIDFAIVGDSSGGSLSPTGDYVAGPAEGDDVVAILDEATGQTINAVVRVRTDAKLTPVPQELQLPLGGTYALKVDGGSGSLAVEVVGDAVTVSDGMIEAVAQGSATVLLSDIFTGEQTSLNVTVTKSLAFEPHRSADLFNEDEAVGAGDINGDGFPDAVLGVGEANIEAVNGGGVYIYAGSAEGLNPTPVRIIGGTDRDQRFGARLVTGDVDGDGLVDLLVAASRSNTGATFAGAVYLYRGVDGEFFEDEPSQYWSGDNGYDYFGFGLTLCDFNGDGGLDLAVGAYHGEDRNADPVVSSQGAVHLFLNTGSGISIAPATKLYGQGLQEDGSWMPQAVRLGYALTSGDLNGDGLCDLVVNASRPTSDSSDDGAVYIYKGVAPEGFSKGGVTNLPVKAIFTDATGDWLGRELAAADFNGDGLEELVVTHSYSDQMTGTFAGSVHTFYGAPLPDVFEEAMAPWDAEWNVIGIAQGNYFGQAVNTGDVNGDGLADLLVGVRQGELVGSPGNTGSLKVFYGVDGGELKVVPDLQVAEGNNGDWFGAAVAVLGDVDGDGIRDIFVHASRNSTYGHRTGRPYMVSPLEEGIFTLPLELPGEAAGQRFGYDVAIFERPGKEPSFLVGAPYHDTPSTYNEGAVFSYNAGEEGMVMSQLFGADVPKVGNNDRLGWSIAPLGDFNGDGFPDLAVAVYAESRPNSLDNKHVCGDSCGSPGTKDCGLSLSYPGALMVFGGTADGSFNTLPLFQYYSPENKQTIRNVRAAGDVNGDGFQDVLVSSRIWDVGDITNTGGVRLILGRPHQGYAAGKTQIICEDDFTFHGHTKDDEMGRGMTSLGDLDGDGCSEFAVGSDREDPSSQGVVRVFFGWDSTGSNCGGNDEATYTTMRSNSSSARAGFALAGGHDVDGDNVPDLVVGAPFYRINNASIGATWLVRGSYIVSLPREAAVSAVPASLGPFSFASGAEFSTLKVTGGATGDEFGWSVALLPNTEADGRSMVAVGSPGSSLSGVPAGGAALVYRYRLDDQESGLESIPWLALSGENYRTGGKFGAAVAGGSGPSGNYLMVGAYYGTSENMDSGTAYIVPVPPVD